MVAWQQARGEGQSAEARAACLVQELHGELQVALRGGMNSAAQAEVEAQLVQSLRADASAAVEIMPTQVIVKAH